MKKIVLSSLLLLSSFTANANNKQFDFNVINNSKFHVSTAIHENRNIDPYHTEAFSFKDTDQFWNMDIYSYDSPDHTFTGFCQVSVDFKKKTPKLHVYSADEYGHFTCKKEGNSVIISNLP